MELKVPLKTLHYFLRLAAGPVITVFDTLPASSSKPIHGVNHSMDQFLKIV